MNAYENLANAIIVQASIDYVKALKSGASAQQSEVEQFFHSEWFAVLTELDPETLIEKLKREVKNK